MLYYILISIIILVIIILICHYFLYYKHNNYVNKKITIEKFDFDDYLLPKIIWVYWHDDNNIPLCVQQIIKNNTAVVKEWKINFLSKTTLSKYISNKEMPSFKGLTHTQISDWTRLYLLEKYGGCWCDASLIINDKTAFYKLRDDSIEKKSLFTGFYFSRYCEGNKFSYVENSFMLAPKNSSIIKAWRKEFENAINMGFYNYRAMLKKNKKLKLKNIYRNYYDVYLTAFACFYNISENFSQTIKDHFILYKAEDTIFKLQEECKWNTACIHKKLKNKEVKQMPYIKLIKPNRKNLDLKNVF